MNRKDCSINSIEAKVCHFLRIAPITLIARDDQLLLVARGDRSKRILCCSRLQARPSVFPDKIIKYCEMILQIKQTIRNGSNFDKLHTLHNPWKSGNRRKPSGPSGVLNACVTIDSTSSALCQQPHQQLISNRTPHNTDTQLHLTLSHAAGKCEYHRARVNIDNLVVLRLIRTLNDFQYRYCHLSISLQQSHSMLVQQGEELIAHSSVRRQLK